MAPSKLQVFWPTAPSNSRKYSKWTEIKLASHRVETKSEGYNIRKTLVHFAKKSQQNHKIDNTKSQKNHRNHNKVTKDHSKRHKHHNKTTKNHKNLDAMALNRQHCTWTLEVQYKICRKFVQKRPFLRRFLCEHRHQTFNTKNTVEKCAGT